MANRLKKMQIRFVSLVDRGAGHEAQVVLAKRDTSCKACGAEVGKSTVCPSCGQAVVAKEDPGSGDSHVAVPMGDKNPQTKQKGPADKGRKKLLVDGDPEDLIDHGSDEGTEGEPSADKKITKNNHGQVGATTVPLDRTPPEESMSGKIEKGDFTELPDEALEYIEKVEDRVLEVEAERDELAKKLTAAEAVATPVAKADESEAEDIFKGLTPGAREHIQKMETDLAEAQAIAKAERDARLDREFLAKAESLSGLAISAADLAPVLKGVGETSPELLAKVTEVLTAASNAVKESALFTEIGKRGSTESAGKVEDIAKALQKADTKLTKEQAFAKALEDNPALYTEYLAETGV